MSGRLLAVLLIVIAAATGCEWRGVNSLKLPGTAGGGDGSFTIQVQLPDAVNIEPNSRVRVGDATVGNVTRVERQGWNALLILQLSKDVDLPENATAALGQTSLLGSMHVELAAPATSAPRGRLHEGSLIPLTATRNYPTTEQTLSAVSLLLNGGGLGNVQDITQSLSSAFTGREQDLRNLVTRLNDFVGYLNNQTGDIIAATESLNNLAGQFAAKQPVLDNALRTVPGAVEVLKEQRKNLTDLLTRLGQFSALTSDAIDKSKESLVEELKQLGPVLNSLANAGPDLTRSLSSLATYPWPNETLEKWVRGDYANLTAVVDLTLSRIDNSLFTGTRWEGNLTELEMQWGRTIGQLPSPYTAGNPLVVPYRSDQGP
ncbi:MCE family protein [Mycolicibacterium fluoranthenivorans]|uniref:MCE family protein n=1 Tax=Mycolicibacterium fluoranthenivorans TaxID=258505 RepID=A0A7G8PGC9_9MYCO|nr:MCE family protein [Mycolicibacterium fluoranthenivorans]QNJ93395.1 MCE family protein [Mycolicibacterium fluoranthenivorans]